MKLNRIKTVLSEKGISQTWLQQIAEILQVDLKDLITDKEER